MNNPPAFPTPIISVMQHTGMTLRDYFAAKAMAICPLRDFVDKSAWCYDLADHMLDARETKE